MLLELTRCCLFKAKKKVLHWRHSRQTGTSSSLCGMFWKREAGTESIRASLEELEGIVHKQLCDIPVTMIYSLINLISRGFSILRKNRS